MNQQEKVKFTQEELNSFRDRLANAHLGILALKERKKEVNAELKEQMEDLERQMDDLADKISKKYYWRDPIRP